MARDDDNDDLYDEEFDFVDDEDESDLDDSELAEERAPAGRGEDSDSLDEEPVEGDAERDGGDEPEEEVDEYGRPEPAANYVVHVYEQQKFKHTIERPFTPEEAEAFATEYNRTGKNYHRVAVAGKNDMKPKKTLD